eukprot:scaffold6034_cov50-Attheya_sp.AAC.4
MLLGGGICGWNYSADDVCTKGMGGVLLGQEDAVRGIQDDGLLMGTLPVQAQRDKALPLMEWVRAVCVREETGVAERRASQMEVLWETPALADRRLIIWASRRLGPFRSPMPVAPRQQCQCLARCKVDSPFMLPSQLAR